MMFLKKQFITFIAVLFLVFGISQSAQALSLTGAIRFSTNSDGSGNGTKVWTTDSGPKEFKLWFKNGSGFINGPTDANANINIPLTNGDHYFTLYGDNQGALLQDSGSAGLNLFFNGDNTNPGISTLVPTNGINIPQKNASSRTVTLTDAPIAGANTLTFHDGAATVTLTDDFWINPGNDNSFAGDPNIVSAFNTQPNQATDYVGGFLLHVTGL